MLIVSQMEKLHVNTTKRSGISWGSKNKPDAGTKRKAVGRVTYCHISALTFGALKPKLCEALLTKESRWPVRHGPEAHHAS